MSAFLEIYPLLSQKVDQLINNNGIYLYYQYDQNSLHAETSSFNYQKKLVMNPKLIVSTFALFVVVGSVYAQETMPDRSSASMQSKTRSQEPKWSQKCWKRKAKACLALVKLW
jgi:hypothetical protein